MKRFFSFTLIFLFCLLFSEWQCKKGPAEVNLSPEAWPKGELENYLELNKNIDRPHPLASGIKCMIAGTTGAPAIRAGFEALKQGGSAIDAALTTALAQISLAAGCWVSYAGILTMVYYEAETGKVYSMHAGYYTVKEEKEPLTIPVSGTPSGRTALVPGFMAGVEEAHKRFGRLPFAKIFEPAIYFAEKGFIIYPLLGNMIPQRSDVLTRLPETKSIFTKENGELYKEGDLFRQPQLADTLRKVASQGANYMYRGEWAQKFVNAVQKEGGKMTLKDLEDYRVIWSEPLHTDYRGFDVYALGFPSTGGLDIIEALNLLEVSDLKSMGHYTSSVDSLYWLIQISRAGIFFTFFPQELFKSHFPEIDFSPQSRAKKQTAALLWEKMQKREWAKALEAIFAEIYSGSEKHSDAVVAVDRWGNVASICHSINTTRWGTTGIFVDGISIPDSACFQQQLIQKVGPGVYLPDPTNPLIVLKGGKPFLASSCIGSGLHSTTLQNLFNILDFEMDPKKAVDTTNFLSPYWEDLRKQMIEEGSFSEELVNGVRAKGQELLVVSSQSEKRTGLGYWIGIKIDPDRGRMEAGVSSLLNGCAIGE